MGKCKTCKYWGREFHEDWEGFKGCSNPKINYDYRVTPRELESDEIIIEPDEGWGMYCGPDFGCVHYKKAGVY